MSAVFDYRMAYMALSAIITSILYYWLKLDSAIEELVRIMPSLRETGLHGFGCILVSNINDIEPHLSSGDSRACYLMWAPNFGKKITNE
jgi:hypothetical protein